MRKRPTNTKPWLVQVKRKVGGRIQSLIRYHTLKAEAEQLRADENPTAAENLDSYADYHRRRAERTPRRAFIHGGAHYTYCRDCGTRDKINNQVCKENSTMANHEIYCVPCAMAKGISFWTRDLDTNELARFDYYI